jgi:hypothetical protein
MAGSSNAIRAGRAFVELFAEDSKLRRGLARAQKMVGRFASSVRASGVVTLKVGLSTAGAAGGLIKALAGPASELEEIQNKFDVVFGKRSAGVKAFGDQLAKDLGRSRIDIAGFLAEAQDLFVPLGFDAQTAEAMSKQLTELGVDLASFNNKADADVIRDLLSAMTGSSEVMKKYGVIVNENAVQQEAMNQGWDAANLSEQQKSMARLAIIMRGTTAAQGDAIRSGSSYANTMKRLQASIKDARAALGAGLLPILARWIGAAAKGVRQVEAWARANAPLLKILAKVLTVTLAVGAAVVAMGGSMVVAGFAMGAVAKVIGGVVLAVKALPAVVGLVTAAFGGMAAAVTAAVTPLGLAIGLIAGVAGYVLYASGALGWFGDAWKTLSSVAMKTLGGIRDALVAGDLQAATRVLWAGLRVLWVRGVSQLTAAWSGFRGSVLNILSGLWTRILQGGVAVVSGLQIAWNTMWSSFERQTQRNGASLLKTYLRLKGKITGEDVSQQIADVDQITRAQNNASRKTQRVVNEEIVSVQIETVKRLGRDQEEGEDQRNASAQATLDRLVAERADADADFAAAIGAAREAREQHEASFTDEPNASRADAPDAPDLESLIRSVSDAARDASGQAAQSVGTFNPAALSRLFAGREHTDTKATAENTRELVRLFKRIMTGESSTAVFS